MSLLGIRKIVVAVNKLDLVDYSRDVSERIEAEYRDFAAQIGLTDVVCIPMSALRGDNIEPSPLHALFHGPTLLGYPRPCPSGSMPRTGRSGCRSSG